MTQIETVLMELTQLEGYVQKYDLVGEMHSRRGEIPVEQLIEMIENTTGTATTTVATEEQPPIVEKVSLKGVHYPEEIAEIEEMVALAVNSAEEIKSSYVNDNGYGKYVIDFTGGHLS